MSDEYNKAFLQQLTGTQKKLLSENEAKQLDYKTLIYGYIRIEINPSTITPQCIFKLCTQYATILDILPNDNPINFISTQDIEQCDKYKYEGNRYYKLKQYEDAITKYTTALRYNPNNYLVLNNRALCYYILKNYKDAEHDAFGSISISPTFYKAWYRYGTILEKQGNYRFAGICYRTAYYLSIDWNMNEKQKQKQNNNQYQKHYNKYMKNLEKSEQKDIINWINNFDEKAGNLNPEDLVFDALSKYNDKDEMKKMMNSQQGMEKMLMDLMQNKEFLHVEEEEKLYNLVEESKYKYLLKTNGFNNNNDGVDAWTISWASTPQIMDNKRMFTIIVASSMQRKMMSQYTHYGVPTARNQLIYLYRTMAFSNLTKVRCSKPGILTIDWRSRFMFDEIQKEVAKLGINCIQETYEESVKVCKPNNTDVDGWNHLD